MKKATPISLAASLWIALGAACGGDGGGPVPPSGEKAITTFSFASPAATGSIDEGARTVSVTVPSGTDVTALVATFSTTGASVRVGTTVQVSGVTANDFTHPVAYTVAAADGSTATYTVTVIVAVPVGGAIDLPRTGQTACYDGAGGEIACAGTGQDGELQAGAAWPDPRFTVDPDTSVLDALTGLAWAPSGNLMPSRDGGWDADGNVDDGMVTWQHALDYVAKLNEEDYLGHDDWRLPNRRELRTLVHYGQPVTAAWLVLEGFADAQSAYYWTSTSYAKQPHAAWLLRMNDGYVMTGDKDGDGHVWPVRGATSSTDPASPPRTGQTTCYDSAGAVASCTGTGQDGELRAGVAWPEPRFTKNADTSITDRLTGLVWEGSGNLMPARDPGWDVDQTVDDGWVTWQHALDYLAKLNAEHHLGHGDWRLPELNELESLVNAGAPDIASWLLSQGFDVAEADGYWSSTTHPGDPEYAWTVALSFGHVDDGAKPSGRLVWPVRTGP